MLDVDVEIEVVSTLILVFKRVSCREFRGTVEFSLLLLLL